MLFSQITLFFRSQPCAVIIYTESLMKKGNTLNLYLLSTILSLIIGFLFAFMIIEIDRNSLYYRIAFILFPVLISLAFSCAVIVGRHKISLLENLIAVTVSFLLMFSMLHWVFSTIQDIFSVTLLL